MPHDCQSFCQGCVGCCVNMRWPDARVLRFLKRNTREAATVFPAQGRPSFSHLVRLHWRRGGFWDHLLMFWLVIPTFGLSALVWRQRFASCCFAGYIEEESGRVGCLIHPLKVGGRDLRRHAFPLVPTASCNRELICPMLRRNSIDNTLSNVAASREGFRSLQKKP